MVHSFGQIVESQVNTIWWDDREASLASLHGLSPTFKSLSMYCASIPLLKLLNLICSFPLLQDLHLRLFFPKDDMAADADGWEAPPNSPNLTGSLCGEIRSVSRKLLDLPNGLHPANITPFDHETRRPAVPTGHDERSIDSYDPSNRQPHKSSTD